MFREKVGQLKGARGPIEIAWEIAHFLSLSTQVDGCYESPAFFGCNASWYLKLCPNGQTEHSSEGHVGLYLVRGDYGPPASVTYSLFLKKTGGKREVLDEVKRTFDKVHLGCGGPKAMRRSELIGRTSEFLPSGVLTVICSLESAETQTDLGLHCTLLRPLWPGNMLYGKVGQLKGARGPVEIAWEIPDFLSLSTQVDVCYESPTFFCRDASWYLRLYPNSQKWYPSEGYVGVYLMRGDLGPPASVTCSLFLEKAGGREEVCREAKQTFDRRDRGWGEPQVVRRSELIGRTSEFLPSGVLTVICSLESAETQTVGGTESAEISSQTTLSGDLPAKVLRDFENILLSEEGTDVTLHIQGRKFEAHRTVLRARSPVFASMLSHDMKEKNTGLIDVKDCDPEVFPDFLRFLYCGSADSITSQTACSLYRAADKYDVQDLKSECLAFIESHLEVDNFCEVVALALRHREAGLLQQATDFFADNMLKIVVTVQWQTFLTENPIPSNELIIKGLSAQKNSTQ